MTVLQNELELIKEDTTEYWGVSSSIDLYDCDLALMQNADAIREFVKILCDRIPVRRYGDHKWSSLVMSRACRALA